jgi:hypothetical protein
MSTVAFGTGTPLAPLITPVIVLWAKVTLAVSISEKRISKLFFRILRLIVWLYALILFCLKWYYSG